MSNITILNTFQEQVGSTWGIDTIGIILGIICFIIAGVFIYFLIKERELVIWLGIIGFIAYGIVFTFGLCSHSTPIYETRYQILATENELNEEFFNHYEIVSQDGLILTIREIKEEG
jgi:hypothetical protein